MKLLPRKLSFQLTPLLDLLLIVIFAQYLEMQETTERQEAELRQEAQSRVAAARQEYRQALGRLSAAREQLDALQQRKSELQQQWEKRETVLEESLRRAIRQQKRVGDLVAELFDVPEGLIEQALDPRNNARRSEQEREELRQAFEELARQRGRAVIRHLLTYEEIRKRADVWELYVTEDGMIVLTAGDNTYRFRAETPEMFEQKLFARYKSLPQPKSLVIILFSYGDAKAGTREAVLEGLPRVAGRMRADTSGRTRFEYANLGFQPRSAVSGGNDMTGEN